MKDKKRLLTELKRSYVEKQGILLMKNQMESIEENRFWFDEAYEFVVSRDGPPSYPYNQL